MNRFLGLLALLFILAIGQVSAQVNFWPDEFRAAFELSKVRAYKAEAYKYETTTKWKKGKKVKEVVKVKLDEVFGYLDAPTSVQDLYDQLDEQETLRFDLKTTAHVFVHRELLGEQLTKVFECDTAWRPENYEGKTYEVPWHAGDAEFVLAGEGEIMEHKDDKVKKLPKPLHVDLQFQWIRVAGIDSRDVDHHGFLDSYVYPEGNDNSATEATMPEDGMVNLWCRSAYWFKPELVYITSFEDLIGGLPPIVLPYEDEMLFVGQAGKVYLFWYQFNRGKPPWSAGGKG